MNETYALTTDADGNMTYTANDGTRIVIYAAPDDWFSVAKYAPGAEESEWEETAGSIGEALEMAEYAVDCVEGVR